MKNLNEYPTPITDELSNSRIGPWKYALPIDHSINLERKLAACRDVLACINSSQILPEIIHVEISATIKATAP